jgi:hypothetical protein
MGGTSVMADKKSDPTKKPEPQKVVRHFPKSPPKPHKPFGKRAPKEKPKNESSDR